MKFKEMRQTFHLSPTVSSAWPKPEGGEGYQYASPIFSSNIVTSQGDL